MQKVRNGDQAGSARAEGSKLRHQHNGEDDLFEMNGRISRKELIVPVVMGGKGSPEGQWLRSSNSRRLLMEEEPSKRFQGPNKY